MPTLIAMRHWNNRDTGWRMAVLLLALVALLIMCLNSYLDPVFGVYWRLFFNSALVGGFLSGSLHALTGADHMTAVLPLIFGKRWWRSGCQGAIWGIGHGVTSSLLGLFSYSMKSFFLSNESLLTLYSYVIDCLVGATLVVIGVMGIWESNFEVGNWCKSSAVIVLEDSAAAAVSKDISISKRQATTTIATATSTTIGTTKEAALDRFTASTAATSTPTAATVALRDAQSADNGSQLQSIVDLESNHQSPVGIQHSKQEARTAAVESAAAVTTVVSVFANGAILGLSWDGLPSLAPAVVLNAWPLFCFLLAYLLGTVLMMSLAAALVGEATCWINRVTKVNIAERLAVMSSVAAVVIGTLWMLSALVKYSHQRDFTAVDDGTAVASVAVDYLNGNDGFYLTSISNNDGTYHTYIKKSEYNHQAYDTKHSLELLLSVGSILSVAAVIWMAAYCEFGFQSQRAHVHQV